jgi:hypothetical protein
VAEAVHGELADLVVEQEASEVEVPVEMEEEEQEAQQTLAVEVEVQELRADQVQADQA